MKLFKIEDNTLFGHYGLVVISKTEDEARKTFTEAYNRMTRDEPYKNYAQIVKDHEVRVTDHYIDTASFLDGSPLLLNKF